MTAYKHEDTATAKALLERCENGCDCAPLIETIVDQNIYVGLWLNSDRIGDYFEIDVNRLSDKVWLEDGATRTDKIERFFRTDRDEATALMFDLIKRYSPATVSV